jgi:glycosyltransferase involved in cell wall biosynthesis
MANFFQCRTHQRLILNRCSARDRTSLSLTRGVLMPSFRFVEWLRLFFCICYYGVDLMNGKPLTLSIIIPVYNEENHIRQCLEAIAAQTVAPDEVIVVDNNSTDNSIKIAQEFSFVKVLKEPKQSVLYARTRGFDAAKSDIIGRIDADSFLPTGWVARVLWNFEHKEIAAVTGPVIFHDMPGAPHNYHVDNFIRRAILLHHKDFPLLYGANMAIRRQAWKRIRTQVCDRRDIHEDLDIAVHLYLKEEPIAYDSKLVGSMSARRYDDPWSEFREYSTYMRRTYTVHGLEGRAPDIAQAFYKLGWFLLWPLRRSYDDTTRRRSLSRLIKGGNRNRKHPMVGQPESTRDSR